MGNLRELIEKNRSYRRFDQSAGITTAQLEKWIELARFSASGRNMQPLKYALSTGKALNDQIFSHLAWAGYLTDWDGPAEGERPVAYIAVLHDKQVSEKYFCDDGIAMQSILLGAAEDGYGGCIIGSVNRKKVAELLKLPAHLEILWMVALGKPAEKVMVEDADGENIRYWRDENDIHHVPKRRLNDLIWPAQ
jgi:nitroreductase